MIVDENDNDSEKKATDEIDLGDEDLPEKPVKTDE